MEKKYRRGGLLRVFADDRRGTVAMVAGIAAVPMFVAAGTAVDMARGAAMRADFQVALDGAALAVAASARSDITGMTEEEISLREAELKQVAQLYVDRNFKPDSYFGQSSAPVSIDIPENGTVKVTGEFDYPTTFMRIVGIDKMDIAASATVERQKVADPKVEIALALDTTGSMQGQKLADAKTAAKNLLSILFDEKPTSPYVKAALVPFAQTVNVGTSNATASWLDTGGLADYSDDNFINTSLPLPKMHNMRAWSVMNNRPWTGCVEARKGSYDTDDTEPGSGNPDTLFTPWFAPDEPSSDTSDGYYADDYANSWSSDGTVSNPKTADKRQRNRSKYAGQAPSLSNSTGPWHGCKGTQPIVPLTNQKATLDTAIDSMTAGNFTHIAQGVMWGWRALSPTEPFTEGAEYDDPEWKKILVLMTDGANTYPRNNSNSDYTHNKSKYSAYGFLAQGRLGTTSHGTAITKLNERLTAACTNAKAAGVEVWTVGFDLDAEDDSDIIELLEDCATDPEKFLNAPDGNSLKEHFKAIAGNILANSLYLKK